VPDDLVVRDGDQDAAGVDVGVELGGGIVGQLEQRAQVVPLSAVGLDAEVVGRTGGHHVSFTISATPSQETYEQPHRRRTLPARP
jgi:hypothetical protein